MPISLAISATSTGAGAAGHVTPLPTINGRPALNVWQKKFRQVGRLPRVCYSHNSRSAQRPIGVTWQHVRDRSIAVTIGSLAEESIGSLQAADLPGNQMPSLFVDLIGFIALLLGLSSYAMHERKSMLFVSSGATLIWALYFLLKGAHTAAAVILVGVARILVGAYAVHWTRNARLGTTIGFLLTVGACSWWTWAGLSSLPSTLAALFLAIASLNFHHQRLRYAFLLGDCLWIWNGFAVESVFGVLSAFMGLSVNSILLLRSSTYRHRLQFTEINSIST